MVVRREVELRVRGSVVLEKRMINKRKKFFLEGKDLDVKLVKKKRRIKMGEKK